MTTSLLKIALVVCWISGSSAWAAYQTYVVHTYGDPALATVAQNELNARGGGSATMHQDQLIIRATPADYAHVSALISQIDTAPTSLTVSVMANSTVNQSHTANQVNVGINRRVWVNGSYQNSSGTSEYNNSYQARTLSGSPVAIGQSTLVGLTNAQANHYRGQVWFSTGTTWVALTDGFRATPKLLPDGRVAISLHQSGQGGQFLATNITARRGEWVKVGDMRIDNTYTTANRGYQAGTYSQITPVWVKVD
ncbi:MAG: hypothetical protein Q4G13_03065 [Moraxella sp.]|nr:hypothetical protein [Moraxella sp.]